MTKQEDNDKTAAELAEEQEGETRLVWMRMEVNTNNMHVNYKKSDSPMRKSELIGNLEEEEPFRNWKDECLKQFAAERYDLSESDMDKVMVDRRV